MSQETAAARVAGRRRPAPDTALVGLVGLTFALVASLGIVLALTGAPVEGDQERGRALTVGSTGSPEVVRHLLTERSAALLEGDAQRWTETVDPGAGEFTARQRGLLRILTALPRASWTYTYAGQGPALPPERAGRLGQDAFIARVRLSYRLAAFDARAVQRDQFLTFARREGRWLIVGDDDAGAPGRAAPPDPWDLGEVKLAHGRSSLVLARPGAAGPSAVDIATLADRAVEQVRELWPEPWPQHVVVVVPANMSEMVRLLHGGTGTEGGDTPSTGEWTGGVVNRAAELAKIAAVTTGQPTGTPGGTTTGNRIVLNPMAFAGLTEAGRQVVLAHESTHVASRNLAAMAVPSWLSEGFADYVAYRNTGLDVDDVAGEALAQLRTGAVPPQLPTAADFDASRGPVSASYARAWLAVRLIAMTRGEADLLEFYRILAAAPPGDTAVASALAFREALGTSEEEFVRAWRDSMVQLARSPPAAEREPVP